MSKDRELTYSSSAMIASYLSEFRSSITYRKAKLRSIIEGMIYGTEIVNVSFAIS